MGSKPSRAARRSTRRSNARPVLGALALWLFAFAAPALAEASSAWEADVASIDAIIDAYYEVVSGPAGVAPDAARDRFLHHPEHWIAIAGVDADGRARIVTQTLDDYHGPTPVPRAEPFYEREVAREVRRTGSIAHVWSDYESARTPGGEPFDCGTNSITLWNDGDRWWVMSWLFDSAACTP